ncbi:hypothetical protein LMH87_002026 [Akanthomyces muscarius]|uniref:Zn(2)-C6 fungal-type domain-containing protein n=1 Tax=Akanthomyces muscarius TaxID=2231603 RepID=A0A9W8Q6X1_AKAMU|nr:hypothetical protein LMH87_002026 [Akanthomyces muscarius]KAJ4147514.1 hypothetical protein LMH87_002026 [Akanthomyces muscarius]
MARTTIDAEGNALERVKKWAPKTRTGCTTCRKRRVKCDEAKPRCRRCKAIGVVCGGYPIVIHEFFANQQQPLTVRELGSSPAPAAVKPSQWDMHIFDLLRTETVELFAGPFARGFWTVNLLQAMRQYPAMWHACLALAATQKQLMISQHASSSKTSESAAQSERHALHVFSLQQYDRSVKSVVEIVTKPKSQLTEADKEAILLAAVMFSSISSLQGDVHEAKVHARHCIQLFQCWNSWETARSLGAKRNSARRGCVLQEEQMVGIVAHFECQFPSTSGPKLTPYCCGTGPLMSVEEAYYEFMLLLCELNAVARRAAQRDAQEVSECHVAAVGGPEPDVFWHYRIEFCAWRRRFNIHRVADMDKPAARQGLRVLELLFMGVEPVLAMGTPELVRNWDEHHTRVWDLYRRSSTILEEEDARRGASKANPWDSERFMIFESPSSTSSS